MKGYKEKTFGDRISAAATARQAALERFRARPAADDPAVRVEVVVPHPRGADSALVFPLVVGVVDGVLPPCCCCATQVS